MKKENKTNGMVIKPYNMDVAIHYKSHVMAMLTHQFIALDKKLEIDKAMMNRMLKNDIIGMDAEGTVFISMSNTRYESYFKPRKASHYEKELKTLIKDEVIFLGKVIGGAKNARYYRINYDHPLIKDAYNGRTPHNISLGSKILRPRQEIAIRFDSWNAAFLIEILHRYPLLHRKYQSEYNRDTFNNDFFDIGSHFSVNMDTQFFKKMTPAKVRWDEVIPKLCEDVCPQNRGMVIKKTEKIIMLNYEHPILNKLGYSSRILIL